MVDQRSKLDPNLDSWLETNLLLSSTLFFATHLVFGWLIASQAQTWAQLLHEQQMSLWLNLEKDVWLFVIQSVAVIVIILITLILSTPVALTTFLFEESTHSDFRGFFSILIWSIVLVFAFCSFGYFADFLVIISATLLFKLDLQKLKYPNWLVITIIMFLASLTFTGGMFLHYQFAHASTIVSSLFS